MDWIAAVTLHEIPFERRTLHGHFARDLEPVLAIDSGDTIAFSTLDAGWHVAPGAKFEPFDDELDAGHALIGPVAVRGAKPGQVLEVRIEEVVPGGWGWTSAAGWSSPLNQRLGVDDGENRILRWTLHEGIARDEGGREVELRPFLGVLGMPPPEPGVHSTGPPRIWGGNIDCAELLAGTTLLLPIPVAGARFSAGDCHARQGDGEVCGTAIECPLERAELTLIVRDEPRLAGPVARTGSAWITFGFDEDLDEAASAALDSMLELMGREHALDRRDALALASVVVDLRITQMVNGVRGVHALLSDNALR
jgi:acetamidase/formamidase